MKTFKDFIKEDGCGVGGVAGIGAPPSNPGTDNTNNKFSEPGVNLKKKKKVVLGYVARKPPKM